MSDQEVSAGLQQFNEQFQHKAQQLVDLLNRGELPEAMGVVRELYEFRHRVFYSEVGHLTRGLHEAIKSFTSDMSTFQTEDNETVKVDASERLRYVIDLTEKTSHETMDRIDSALTLVDRLDNQSSRFKDLLSLVGQLEGEYEALDGVYERTCELRSESEKTVEALRGQLTEIVVSQSYQDVSGQLIRRVITLISNVEQHLVQLMEMAASVETMAGLEAEGAPPPDGVPRGNEPSATPTKAAAQNTTMSHSNSAEDPIKAEGPQVKGKEEAGAACDQDDVDELLSSLGF